MAEQMETGIRQNLVHTLTLDWQRWLKEALERQCSEVSLIESMRAAGFPVAMAVASIAAMRKQLAGQTEVELGNRFAQNIAETLEFRRFNHPSNIIKTFDREVQIALNLKHPIVAYLNNMLSHEECDAIVEASRSRLVRSMVVDNDRGGEKLDDSRTSYGAHFQAHESALITRVDRRIAEVMNWPVENGEHLQILRYAPGAQYKAHHDYFDLTSNGGAHGDLSRGGQRVSTMVLYLNDVEEGGTTTFPRIGLTVSPKKGSAVYFEYTDALGRTEDASFHSGDPVIKGEKWIATRWMRQTKFV
jgi:prolyl 4-hydroxylase